MVAVIKVEVAGQEVSARPHDPPVHLDELVSIWLIEEFGDEEFLKQYAKRGVILVGTGGGALDEHPTLTTKRKSGECAATLTAKALGIENDPGLKRILEFTLRRDLKGGGHPFDLAGLARLSAEGSLQEAYQWVGQILDKIYEQDSAFQENAGPEYKRTATESILRVGTKQLKMAVLHTDNVLARKFAISPSGARSAVVIQMFGDGHIQIFSQMRLISSLDDVARLVRLAEIAAKGRLAPTDWDRLAAEGQVAGAEEWWYHRSGGALLNGRSPDNWGVQATELSVGQIERIVRIGVDYSWLPSHCPRRKCLGQGCGWFVWGLTRCQQIRRKR